MPQSANERQLVTSLIAKVGETATIRGWVVGRRDHGKLIFLDVQDRSGLLQVVVNPSVSEAAHAATEPIRESFVVTITGKINQRGERQINPDLETGTIELEATDVTVDSEAKTLPFTLEDTRTVNEEVRLKYRYIDLRSQRMAQNLQMRHKAAQLVRTFLSQHDFTEVETPLLTKTAPEGARDFLVPSRLQPGKFYALPQSPQQYKQLLMIAGLERYFQLSKALRDEDLRGDRQLEHTQIDMEMAFVEEADVRAMAEDMLIHVVESLGKKVAQKPFPVFTHAEAMEKFGADKFDLRDEKDPDMFAFAWVVDFPLLEWDEDEKRYTFAHNPFSAPKAEDLSELLAGNRLGELKAQQYDLVCNGYEIASGGVRISDPTVQRKIFEIMGLTPEQTEERFGHLIHAYEYGAPKHAGIGIGFDRFVMLLTNEENIREVIAFPVTSSGATSVMQAPSEASPRQLKELHIHVDPVESTRTDQ
jgi:aspartyl-tRNA synthetase